MKKTTAIYIDASNSCISEIMMNEGIEELYEILNTETVIAIYPEEETLGNDHILFIDDTVLYSPIEEINGAFIVDLFGEKVVFGNGIIVAYNTKGTKRIDVNLSYQYVADNVRFLSRKEFTKEYNAKRDKYASTALV
jgi:hypothetical protein